VRVLDGNARVAAYLSQIRNDDAMYIAARKDAGGTAPAITAPEWRSDFWSYRATPATGVLRIAGDGERSVDIPVQLTDVVGQLFDRTITAGAMTLFVIPTEPSFAATRIVHGDTTQGVPLSPISGGGGQHLLFVENNAEYRTNLGIVTEQPVTVEFRTYDGNGVLVDQRRFSAGPGLYQFPVTQPVTNGHAEVLFLAGPGRAFASLIDRGTGDATFF
jgi:hypothetical protein